MSEHPYRIDPRQKLSNVARTGFRSIKTVQPIRYRFRWHGDLLIQQSLSPQVRSIELNSDQSVSGMFSLVILGDAEKCILVAAEDSVDCSDLPSNYRIIRRFNVMEEPRRLNCRLVWSCARVHVPAGDRMRVLKELSNHPIGVPLGKIAELILVGPADPFESIFALVCGGVATVDYAAPLTPESLVWTSHPLRPASPSDSADIQRAL